MNDNEFDLAARAWLDDGPTRMSDRALLSALEEIHTTRQRRPLWPAWGATPVNTFARMAIAAVFVAMVGVLAVNVVPRQPHGSSVGGPLTASSTANPTASPLPSASPIQAVIVLTFPSTFVSPTNGYTFGYLDRGGLEPAKELWNPATQPFPDGGSGGHDEDPFDVVETGLSAFFMGASTVIPDGVRLDAWVDEYISSHACGVPRSQQPEITIDGRAGRISECPNRIDATVDAGGRLYLFTLLHNRAGARASFDAWVATIDLTPETAASPSTTPS